MISVILVDDDRMALDYLEGMIDWGAYGFALAGRAHDGRQGFELYKKTKPQLIITDISMPIQDGIDMAEQIRQTDKDVRIVFLSSYKEFDYVRQAMHMGVDDYILKHELDENNLLDKLIHIKQRILSNNTQSHQELKKAVRLLLDKGYKVPHAMQQCFEDFPRTSFYTLLLEEDRMISVLSNYTEQTAEFAYVEDVVHSYGNKKSLEIYTVKLQGHFLILCESESSVSQAESRKSILVFAQAILKQLEEKSRSTFSVCFLASPIPLYKLPNRYPAMQTSMQQERINRKAFCIESKLERNVASEQEPVLIIGIETALENGDEKALCGYLEDGFGALAAAEDIKGMELYCGMCLELLFRKSVSVAKMISGEAFRMRHKQQMKQIKTWRALIGWIAENMMEMCRINRLNASERFPRHVKDAVLYIQKNYSNSMLSVEDIAAHTGKNRNYLGNAFREHLDTTIADYLTNIRIQKAKELMETDLFKVYQISEMVGYSSSQYFSRVFKKVTGYTPYEYKQKQ